MAKITNHKEVLDALYEMDCAIERLYWVAAVLANDYDQELLSDLEEWQVSSLEKVFKLDSKPYDWKADDTLNKDAISEWLIWQNKLGFYAEIRKAYCTNFSFNEDGTPKTWSSSFGRCWIFHVYGETPAELFENIRSENDKIFQEMIGHFKESEVRRG